MRIARGAQGEIHLSTRADLAFGQEQLGTGGLVESGVFHVLNDADDGEPGILKPEAHAAAESAFVPIVGPCHGVVDDHGGSGSLDIASVEEASFKQTRAHGFEEMIADGLPVIDVIAGSAGNGREVFDLGVVGIDAALRRKPATWLCWT